MFNPFRRPTDFGFDVNALAQSLPEGDRLEFIERHYNECRHRFLYGVLKWSIRLAVLAGFSYIGIPLLKLPW